MSDEKLLCYDKVTGTYFLATSCALEQTQACMNKMLMDRGHLSLSDVIDILNENLPDDKKIGLKLNGWDECGIMQNVGDVRYSYDRCLSLNSAGTPIIVLDFIPNDSTENWERL